MRGCRDCLSISFQQAMQMVENERASLIDVRSKAEYDKWHLARSLWIPLERIPSEVIQTQQDRSRKIVLYCTSGARSSVACQLLSEAGYRNVYSIDGGVKP